MQIYKDPADLKTDKVVFKVITIFPANLPAGWHKETHSSRPSQRSAPPGLPKWGGVLLWYMKGNITK
jgi:hypothetical protein